jgi:hypothetical protein
MASAGGFLEHSSHDGQFRLCAMLPTSGAEPVGHEDPPRARPRRVAVLGVATAAAVFAALPVTVLMGVR